MKEQIILKKVSEQTLPKWETNEKLLISELKILIKETYDATFVECGNAMKMTLKNGQKFNIIIQEY